MTRDLRKRIEKLESQMPPQPTEQDKVVKFRQRLLRFGVAYYLGNPTEDRSPEEAYSLALGYASPFEFRRALEASGADFRERVALAKGQLLARFVSRDNKGNALRKAFERWKMACPNRTSDACIETSN